MGLTFLIICLLRGNGTQKEHMDIAVCIKSILIDELPTITKALNWSK